jgi:broad specificity phosphatase PhoE
MTRVLLVRHGNTFSATDKVVWVGARTDLCLTPEGQQQAAQLGQRLKYLKIKPDLIACGPLKRTLEHAAILKNTLEGTQDIEIMSGLREIDYGAWEGLSSAEIESQGGANELALWHEKSVWPTSPNWMPHASEIQNQCAHILSQIKQNHADKTTLLVSSNGILRFFAAHAIHQHAFENFRMKTGHLSEMHNDGENWFISSWNQAPERFTSSSD